jgi:hypothetical protein
MPFRGLHRVNVRQLAVGLGQYIHLAGTTTWYIFLSCKTYRSVLDYSTLKIYFSLYLGKLTPGVIRKAHPRAVVTFIKAVGLG